MSFIAHLVGDYIFQTDHMAQEKTKHWVPAILHGLTYGIPFALLGITWPALVIIVGTHIVIDRYRLAKYIVWAKNQLAPKAFRPVWRKGPAPVVPVVAPTQSATDNRTLVNDSLRNLLAYQTPKVLSEPQDSTNYANKATGYSEKTPDWMAVWLMVIADNTIHIVLNTIAILFFGTIWVA